MEKLTYLSPARNINFVSFYLEILYQVQKNTLGPQGELGL